MRKPRSFLHDIDYDRCRCGHYRRAHNRDLPWARCSNTACQFEPCDCEEFLPAIVTSKGTVIQRYPKTGVGKLVGSHLYLHGDYALEAIAKIKAGNPDVGLRLELSLHERIKEFPAFQFRCLRLDLRGGLVRFDEAPDFDTAREPHVGKWLLVAYDGYHRRGESQAIWHHKHLWVKDSYKGFNVRVSADWSAKYAPLLDQPPLSSDEAWAAQLKAIGLPVSA